MRLQAFEIGRSIAVLMGGCIAISLCPAADASDLAASDQSVLQEVVVTAQKKEERLQDVPVPVSALNADALTQNGQLRLEDYYTQVPGLAVTASPWGQPSIVIRGLSAGGVSFVAPTVGIVVDDVPYGSSTPLGGGNIFPDIDPSDLQSIEVLRGPQGTLYGASSMGGLLKFVVKDPSAAALSGRLEGSVNGVQNGDGAGYAARGSVNVPLGETLALRASGYYRRDAGYIDDLRDGSRGANRANSGGGRLSLLWRPSDAFSLKVSATLQHEKQHGFDAVDATFGLENLQQNIVPGVGTSDRRYGTYTAQMKLRLGGAELTSITGYSINTRESSLDASSSFGKSYHAYPDYSAGCGSLVTCGAAITDGNRTSKVSEEIRLSTPIGQHIDWLLGGFYTHEYTPYLQQDPALNYSTGAYIANPISFTSWDRYTEFGEFSDLTVHFTERLDVQLGARESQSRESFKEIDSGVDYWVEFFDGFPNPLDYPKLYTRSHSFTYLVTPSLKLADDLMIYARLASGFRPGGPNGGIPAQYQVSPSYGPDKTLNYEVGVKGDLLDRRLSFDASVYYIDWKDVQLPVSTPNGYGYTQNGSRAKSEGVELSGQARPVGGLTLGGWFAWNEAIVTENFPPHTTAFGGAGSRLAYSPRISGNLSLDDQFAFVGGSQGFVGAALSYVGDREDAFPNLASTPAKQRPRNYLPAYAKLDLHTGVRKGGWNLSLFANNVTDRRGQLVFDHPPLVSVIPPRTVGLSLSRAF